MSSVDISTLFGVKGLIAVITGGGTGIGLMMAKALEGNGAKVYIVGRRKEVLEKAAKEAKHGNIIPLQGDVTSKSDLLSIVSKIASTDGYINILIANSGITGPSVALPPNPTLKQFRDKMLGIATEDFTNTFHTNISAVFLATVAFLELLDEGNKRGNVEQKSQVVTTASIGAFERRAFAGIAYGPSKAGVIHLMKQLSTNFAPWGIRCNVIAPGFYPSEMTASLFDKHGNGRLPAELCPAERAGNLEDMAGNILFIASKAGAYLNGNVLITDGGRLGVLPSSY